MSPGLHRVRRQSWHLRMASAEEAFSARARFRAEVEDLLPAFNRAFDAWTPGDEVVRIPRLELTLRIASLDDLERALGEALRRETPPRAAEPARPVAADRLATLLRYLKTGALEWHSAQCDATSAAAELRKTALAELRGAAAGIAANAALPERMQYALRLLQLIPGERWPELARAIQRVSTAPATVSASVGDELALIALAGARTSLGAYRAQELAAFVLATADVREGDVTIRQRQLALLLGRDAETARDALVAPLAQLPAPAARLLAARAGLATFPTEEKTAVSRSRVSEPRSDGAKPLRRDPPPQTAGLSPTPSRAVGIARAIPPSAPEWHAETEPAGIEDAGPALPFALMANNAGMVLLHPFLPQLFEACGVCRRTELLSLARGAALLHWLATGSDEPYEFELGTVKLLLGLRPEAPLPVSAGLIEERDREEGTALLRAAIAHWKALKRTSIDGLRVSFLRRRGALREEDTGWRLQLETESFDVLLKHLPWGISTVKLPWMTRPLYTDWPTP